MKIGLYFGSFNPIHIGHLIVASFVANHTEIQQVWFVVSPQNPLKTSSVLLHEYNRLHLVQLAMEDDIRLRASDVEFRLPRPSYTIDTLMYLQEKYPQHQFSIIMGSDSFCNLTKWKNYKVIIKNHLLYIYNRPGFSVENTITASIKIVDAPLLEISSTRIRKLIKEGKSIRYLLPDSVKEEIEKNNYYK